MTETKPFHIWLQDSRREKGLTQAEVVKELGGKASQPRYSDWETGKRSPQSYYRRQLKRILG